MSDLIDSRQFEETVAHPLAIPNIKSTIYQFKYFIRHLLYPSFYFLSGSSLQANSKKVFNDICLPLNPICTLSGDFFETIEYVPRTSFAAATGLFFGSLYPAIFGITYPGSPGAGAGTFCCSLAIYFPSVPGGNNTL